MFKGKKILVTGGTGSLGKALTKKLLDLDAETVRIFSRNESKQIEMESDFEDKRLRFFVGDVRDSERLFSALEDVDIVFHAAALKHVPKIEYNPFESIKTNVIGSQNVIDNSLKQDVEKEKEDRKDERTKIQATQQSEMIEQRNSGKPPKNFESAGNDILGGGFDLGSFDPS